jgi:hypothetical protein
MKREIEEARRGGSTPGEQTITKHRQGAGKIFAKKEGTYMTADSGREAAFEHLGDVEHCRDLAGKFAREAVGRTGDAISNVRDRYETIVDELLAARYVQRDGRRYSLSSVLLSECGTDKALKEFLDHLGKWIKPFALRYYIYREPHNTWVMRGSDVRAIKTLRGRSVSENLMKALAVELERDPEALMRFLEDVFKRWRKIFDSMSLWRVQLVTQQFASDVPHHQIVQHLEKIAAVPKCSAAPKTKAYARLRWKIKKYRSRDQTEALLRKLKPGQPPVTRTAGKKG